MSTFKTLNFQKRAQAFHREPSYYLISGSIRGSADHDLLLAVGEAGAHDHGDDADDGVRFACSWRALD